MWGSYEPKNVYCDNQPYDWIVNGGTKKVTSCSDRVKVITRKRGTISL